MGAHLNFLQKHLTLQVYQSGIGACTDSIFGLKCFQDFDLLMLYPFINVY